jgi:hypothetical protein
MAIVDVGCEASVCSVKCECDLGEFIVEWNVVGVKKIGDTLRALIGGFIRLVQEYEQSETSGRARAAMLCFALLCLASHERHHTT